MVSWAGLYLQAWAGMTLSHELKVTDIQKGAGKSMVERRGQNGERHSGTAVLVMTTNMYPVPTL